MGEVYRAVDPRLGREVAIKVLPEKYASDPDTRSRFEQEARAASALNHPNIVTVYDVGLAPAGTYIAMELVNGRTLRELLTGTPLAARKILDVAAQVADGLAKAHAAGIVHRDLKPENVMLTDDGFAKILDFGLAKLLPGTRRDPNADTTPDLVRLTEPGKLVGTVGYMSPEQASDLPVDHRSDQFSFGAILYEMATGRRAFHRKTAVETMAAIINDDPTPAATLNPALPAPLRWIVDRCLAKEAEDRYASTWDLARELGSVRDHLAEISSVRDAPAAEPKRARDSARWASILIPAAALLLAALLVSRGGPRRTPTFQQVTFRRGYVTNARFGRDGETIVYAASWEGAPLSVATTRLGSIDSRPLLDGSADLLGVSKGDEVALLLGRRYVFGGTVNAGILARGSLAGGAPRERAQDVQQADFAPDGADLAIVRDAGGKSRLEYPIGTVLYETSGWISCPRVSPTGDEVAFLDHPSRGDDTGVVAIVDRKKRKRSLGPVFTSTAGLAWSPDGDEVWTAAAKEGIARSLWAIGRGGRARQLLRVTGTLTLHDVARGGSVLLSHDAERTGMAGRFAGEAKERDLSWLDETKASDLAPGGDAILFTEAGEAVAGRSSVFYRKADAAAAVRLGDGIAHVISPDGKWALISAWSPPPRALQLLPIGPGEPRVIAADAIDHAAAAWVSGDRILFAGNEPGRGSRLFVQPLSGGAPRAISPEGTWINAKTVSPDGRLVAAVDAAGAVTIYDVDGGPPRPVPGVAPGDVPLAWGPDASSLLVCRRGELPTRIRRIDLATGASSPYLELLPPDAAGVLQVTRYRASADGRAYAYSYLRTMSELFVVSGVS